MNLKANGPIDEKNNLSKLSLKKVSEEIERESNQSSEEKALGLRDFRPVNRERNAEGVKAVYQVLAKSEDPKLREALSDLLENVELNGYFSLKLSPEAIPKALLMVLESDYVEVKLGGETIDNNFLLDTFYYNEDESKSEDTDTRSKKSKVFKTERNIHAPLSEDEKSPDSIIKEPRKELVGSWSVSNDVDKLEELSKVFKSAKNGGYYSYQSAQVLTLTNGGIFTFGNPLFIPLQKGDRVSSTAIPSAFTQDKHKNVLVSVLLDVLSAKPSKDGTYEDLYKRITPLKAEDIIMPISVIETQGAKSLADIILNNEEDRHWDSYGDDL